ncbi:MAG: bis(5'-nucleosyl)-tetraphosphatase (symmetrical) YqeK [Coriobacteriales bacterium]|nr:bis(5'-nucleosyl)-tetraphosphatase (symmetrical) YqeK [Coriobacteriales bacterium]
MQDEYQQIYNEARLILETRLNEYRLLHSISVADTAASMARQYGVDVDKACVAGLLHDWDKNLSDEELVERARGFGIEMADRLEDLAFLLHAQTGAMAVKQQFPGIDPEITQAIARHTSAAPDMTELDMIIYIADIIEPLRSRGNLTPLRTIAGKVPLELLFLKSLEMTMEHLIKRHRFIHPDSLQVWNSYIARERGM